MAAVAQEYGAPLTILLPKPTTVLIGRQEEIRAVHRLLQRSQPRLVTFTGPPGVGKSRLCVQVASELRDSFPDGLCFVPLAPIREAGQVAAIIAQCLGLQDLQADQTVERLQTALARRRMLLILDNFEQVLAAAPLLTDLLAAAPALTLFVTSRVALRLSGEHEYLVPPLELPAPNQLNADALLQAPAVALFVARAQAVQADFQLTPANAAVVGEICRRLAGIPLAIELAAARSKLLPPPALLARLTNRLATLTHGARDLPARQQTLRAAIEWSHDLLAPAEQRLFRRLGVFVDGWSVEAAEAIGGDVAGEPFIADISLNPLDGLATLLDHSLIYAVATPGGEPRYAMLELLGEFAQEELTRSGEEPTLRRRHARYYLALAQRAPLELEVPVQRWYDELELEHNNLRAALQWASANGELQLTMQAIIALGRFWWERGHLRESLIWTHRALDLELRPFAVTTADYARSPFSLPPSTERAGLLYQVAFVYWVMGEWAEAIALGEQSLALYRQLHDRRGASWLTRHLSMVFADQGSWAQAKSMAEESLALCQALGDRGGQGFAALVLGRVCFHLGEGAESAAFFDQSETLFRQIGQVEGLFAYLQTVGELAVQQGDTAQALPKLAEGVELARQIDHKAGVVMGLLTLAAALIRVGDELTAFGKTQEALTLLRTMGVQDGLSGCYVIFARLASNRQLPDAALRFWQVGETFQFQRGFAQRRNSLIEQLRAALAEQFRQPTYLARQEIAAALPLEQAFATLENALHATPAASAERPQPVTPATARPSSAMAWAELTAREQEVLRLLARGLTYSEIAEALVVSPRTVDAHLRAIYGKLGVKSRHEAARLAREKY